MRKVKGIKTDKGYELNLTLILNSEQIENRKDFLTGKIRGIERDIARLTDLKTEHEDELRAIEELIQ